MFTLYNIFIYVFCIYIISYKCRCLEAINNNAFNKLLQILHTVLSNVKMINKSFLYIYYHIWDKKMKNEK